ncbi:branched-chain amino acid transport system substrate-binding protein [Acidovorax soli]|uniref:Branched-chain amino acid transport system substrate-binding protein n=1 Tax=Acidovorax soli TaxID=592050 RepID=A0A7X0U8T9_9BURK|nr:ABC transporter substrate-binding protein [Acidovorax soli]MBB6559318.1 branched-chain amino acid transport system substrate-binding protein [Acidovorax soli]
MTPQPAGAGRGASLRAVGSRVPPWRFHALRRVLQLLPLLLLSLPVAHAQPGANKPIKVGAVSALSGPYTFPESSQAAKAYLDAVNATGGIRGRRIEYFSLDEGSSSAAAAAAAGKLINDPEVVALAGSSGLMDCAVNAARYEAGRLMSLQGASVSPSCFTASHVVPLNNGPYVGLASAVLFARHTLRSSRLCAVVLDLPGMVEGYRQALDRLAKIKAIEVPPLQTLGPEQDPAPLLQSVKAQGCDAVIFTGHEAAVLRWSEAALAQGVHGMTWIYLTPAYTDRVARALATRDGGSVYVMAEFEPWKSRSLPSQDWRRLMQEARLPLSSLSQGGYVAAQMLVRAMRQIESPINRETVTRALQQMPPTSHPLLGMPFEIGERRTHNPNRTALPLKLQQGHWYIATPTWIEVPELMAP